MKSNRYVFAVLLCFYSSLAYAQWTQEQNYPGGYTKAMVSFVIGDTIYLGGGSAGGTSFYKYDPSSGEWTKRANLPRQCADAVSFSVGSKGYMALGQSDPTSQTNSQASVTNDLWQYDPATDQWTPMTNFPGAARDASIAFVIGNKVYVGGGVDATYYPYSDFYSYDPSSNTWTALGNLPDYLYFGGGFTIGNFGYVATGVNSIGESSLLWQYDTTTDSWASMPNFPGPARESPVAFTLNGLGYVGLGQSGYDTEFTDFYFYNPTDSGWTRVTSFPTTLGRGWAVGVATTSAAFVGLGSYFADTSIYANNDFWTFTSLAGVAAATPVSTPNAFPNPAVNFVNLSLPPSVNSAQVSVQNSIGVTCLMERLNSDERLDLSSLPAGIYNLEISAGEYHSMQRIVKE